MTTAAGGYNACIGGNNTQAMVKNHTIGCQTIL